MTPPLPEAVEEAKAHLFGLIAGRKTQDAVATILTTLQAIEEEKANAIHARDTWKAWHDGIVARNATLQSALAEALGALEPFAIEAGNWADSVPNSHQSLCTEPGSKQAHPGSETAFTMGDLRKAAEVHARLQSSQRKEG